MGHPIEPGEKGVDCPHCTPGTWAVGNTPKYLMVMVTGIVSCPAPPPIHFAPPNGAWILEQKIGGPCEWFYIKYPWHLRYTVTAVDSRFYIRDVDGFLAFDDVVATPCEEHFTNSVICAPNVNYHEGSAFIDLFDFPGTAYQLMYEYGLNPDPRSRLEVYEVPGEGAYVQVRRCANIYTPMNIRIKTDATHKDQYEMFEK